MFYFLFFVFCFLFFFCIFSFGDSQSAPQNEQRKERAAEHRRRKEEEWWERYPLAMAARAQLSELQHAVGHLFFCTKNDVDFMWFTGTLLSLSLSLLLSSLSSIPLSIYIYNIYLSFLFSVHRIFYFSYYVHHEFFWNENHGRRESLQNRETLCSDGK